MSTKERVGRLDKALSLEEPSLAIIVHLKMETTHALFVMSSTFFVYKKNVKLIKECLQCLLLFTSC